MTVIRTCAMTLSALLATLLVGGTLMAQADDAPLILIPEFTLPAG